jgi:hypothetical protein
MKQETTCLIPKQVYKSFNPNTYAQNDMMLCS